MLPEYVEAMWLMLQQEKPEDYVIATRGVPFRPGISRRGLWVSGIGLAPICENRFSLFSAHRGGIAVRRPRKGSRRQLGWHPQVTFKELVRLMTEADLKALLEMRQCQDVIRQIATENGLRKSMHQTSSR